MPEDAVTAAITAAVATLPPDTEVVSDEPTPEPTSDPTPDPTPVEGDKPAADKPAVTVEKSEEEELAEIEKEFLTKNPNAKAGRIGISRHQAVLTRNRRQYEAKLADAEKKSTDALARAAQYETDDHKAQLKFLELIEKSPDRAVEVLRQVDPVRYAKLVWQADQAAAAPEAKPATPKVEVGEKPKPDRLNSDGSLGYSAEQADKLAQWHAATMVQQEVSKHSEELKKLREELSPTLQTQEAAKEVHAAVERMKPVLEDARSNWTGFKDNEKDIRAYMAKPGNERMSLFKAYSDVVVNKYQALAAQAEKAAKEAGTKAAAEAQAKLVADANERAKAGSTFVPGRQPAAVSDPNAPRNTEDIIREQMRKNGL